MTPLTPQPAQSELKRSARSSNTRVRSRRLGQPASVVMTSSRVTACAQGANMLSGAAWYRDIRLSDTGHTTFRRRGFRNAPGHLRPSRQGRARFRHFSLDEGECRVVDLCPGAPRLHAFMMSCVRGSNSINSHIPKTGGPVDCLGTPPYSIGSRSLPASGPASHPTLRTKTLQPGQTAHLCVTTFAPSQM